MEKLTLKFKPSDFVGNNYTNGSDCAITRALKRAGFPDAEDAGLDIRGLKIDGVEIKINTFDNKSYKSLSKKVQATYGLYKEFNDITLIKPFQHTLKF